MSMPLPHSPSPGTTNPIPPPREGYRVQSKGIHASPGVHPQFAFSFQEIGLVGLIGIAKKSRPHPSSCKVVEGSTIAAATDPGDNACWLASPPNCSSKPVTASVHFSSDIDLGMHKMQCAILLCVGGHPSTHRNRVMDNVSPDS